VENGDFKAVALVPNAVFRALNVYLARLKGLRFVAGMRLGR
jgi:hypothetical protein